MSEPIVIIDSSEIREGKLDDLKAAMKELVEFALANEPRMIAYNVYLSEDGNRVTVLQVHPDSESAEFHMKVAGPAFAGFAEFIKMSGIDIYGRPSQGLLERLRLKARTLDSGNVIVHELHAGFARF
jgi:quinol monooxygenase YgiN